MLTAQVEPYISLRQKLGYQLRELSGNLRAFASFASNRGDTHVRALTVADWAAAAPEPVHPPRSTATLESSTAPCVCCASAPTARIPFSLPSELQIRLRPRWTPIAQSGDRLTLPAGNRFSHAGLPKGHVRRETG